MPIEIRHVTKLDELLAVYRQRYRVYVEELKYPQQYADHAARTVVEPLDSHGHILGAYEDGVLVGSIRINFGSEAAFGNYVDLYHMRSFGSYFPKRLSICTKFIVAGSHRATTIMNRLSKAAFSYAPVHRVGNVFNLIDSKPPLDGYFRRLGYRQLRPSIMHPDAAEVIPLVLTIFDKSYLERVGSPFARLLPGMRDDESVRWFYQTFANELVQYDIQEPCRNFTKRVYWEAARQSTLPVSRNVA